VVCPEILCTFIGLSVVFPCADAADAADAAPLSHSEATALIVAAMPSIRGAILEHPGIVPVGLSQRQVTPR
jgi:hypothetical protein